MHLPFSKVILGAFVLGFVIGGLSGVSFLRTIWSSFHLDFFLWFSIVSFFGNIFLILVTQEQIFEAQNKKNISDAQIQIWFETVKGVITALSKIQNTAFSGDKNTKFAISLVEPAVSSLFQSLSKAAGIESESSKEADQEFNATMSVKALDAVKQNSPSKPENSVPGTYNPIQGDREVIIKSSQFEKINKTRV